MWVECVEAPRMCKYCHLIYLNGEFYRNVIAFFKKSAFHHLQQGTWQGIPHPEQIPI